MAEKKKTKTVAKKKTKKQTPKEVEEVKKEEYWEGIGRRKTATARVRLWPKGKGFLVNEKPLKEYFPISNLVQTATAPLEELKLSSKFKVTAKTSGGGIGGQAEAVRHGLARALAKFDPKLQKTMREQGFLTRDSRMKERKKPGLKRARKAPQWQKR